MGYRRSVADFRRQVVVGVGWTAAQKWTLRLAGFVTFVVLSRLLQPSEIGLVTLAFAVTGIAGIVADLGVSTYVVQAEEMGSRESSSAFWMGVGLSSGIALLVVVLAAPIASLLGEPQLEPVLRALCLNLVVMGLSVTPVSLLVRDMRFKALAVREIASGLVSAVVGITLAVLGAGVWALVAQSLTQSVVALVLVWSMVRWRPLLRIARADVVAMTRFGTPLLGAELIRGVRDRLEQFLLGSLAGVSVLGYWAVATRLLAVVTEVTVSVLDLVALPVFVRARAEEGRFSRTFEQATTISALLLTPVLAALAVLSPLLIPLLFGPAWEPAVVPAQILCGAYALGSLAYFNRAAFLARGRSDIELVLTVVGLVTHLLVVVLLGPRGLVPLAVGMVVESFVILLLGAVVLRTTLGIRWWVYGRGLVVLAVSASTGLVMALVTSWADALPPWADVLLTASVGVGVYVALLLLVQRDLVVTLLADLRNVVGRRGVPPGSTEPSK